MEKKDLRIVFMGTPEFAVESLKALVEGGYNVVAVVTQPDKPVGRHQDTLQAPPVKLYALEHGLPVMQPEKMKSPDFIEELRGYNADLQVVVAFRMLPEVVWSMPRFGTFNVHAALLPQYRGAAPINWAVINGDTITGVTTFFLDHNIDTGRIIEQRELPIPDDADVEYVYDHLMVLGAEIAVSTVNKVIQGNGMVDSRPQGDFDISDLRPAPKIFKETCQIDFRQPAKKIYDFIRGLSPYPGAWVNLESESLKPLVMKIFKSHKVASHDPALPSEICEKPETCNLKPATFSIINNRLYVGCKDGCLEILELQISGKKRMQAKDFLNGFRQIISYKCV